MENEQVLNFMQITECHDYNKATEYMAMANNNLEVFHFVELRMLFHSIWRLKLNNPREVDYLKLVV